MSTRTQTYFSRVQCLNYCTRLEALFLLFFFKLKDNDLYYEVRGKEREQQNELYFMVSASSLLLLLISFYLSPHLVKFSCLVVRANPILTELTFLSLSFIPALSLAMTLISYSKCFPPPPLLYLFPR